MPTSSSAVFCLSLRARWKGLKTKKLLKQGQRLLENRSYEAAAKPQCSYVYCSTASAKKSKEDIITVVMEQIGSDGRRRQCNASCHNAKKPICRCICGGKFHGSARNGTFEQKVDEFRQEMLDEATRETPVVVTESWASPGTRQPSNPKVAVQGRLPL